MFSSVRSFYALSQWRRFRRSVSLTGWGWLCVYALLVMMVTIRSQAHNLDMRTDYLGFDKETLDMCSARSAAGQALIQPGDTIGLVMKATPNLGTPTGAGGYSTFFVPVGSQVVNAEYGRLDSTGAFVPMAVKGQSILALGDGARGAKKTTGLIGLTLGPNINGQTASAVDSSGYANGTMVGVYSDTGIFYSTDPKTAWQSWVRTGGYDGKTLTTTDNSVTASSGRVVVPTTRWDAEQLLAFGSSSPVAALLDSVDMRGNAPWGMASAVAGPECGYAWSFDKTYWDSNPSDPSRMKHSVTVGPWRRIKYEGSQSSKDTPGLRSTTTGYAAVDASAIGYDLSPANPLPATTSWTDNTSPKAVRIAWGNTELYHPEYARMQVKILVGQGQPNSPFDASGFLQAYADTFGGDAGGEYNNFDHLWHYYRPTTATLSGHPFIFKQVSKPLVMPNEVYSYKIWLINFGSTTLTNVKVQDTLPSGVKFLSASPTPASGPTPLVWNYPVLTPGSLQSISVTVQVTGSGVLTNTVCSSSDQFPSECATDTTVVSGQPLLYADKTVTPTSVQPGNSVNYTMTIENAGTTASAIPLVINEALPTGFTYNALLSATIGDVPTNSGAVTVSIPSGSKPTFTINQAIPAGQTLAVTFKAKVSDSQLPGSYCNRYSFINNGHVNSTGSLACVNVTGVRLALGNLVFFDVNGDGHANPGEGVPNVSLELYRDGMTAGVDSPLATTTTDSDGLYLFDFLDPGVYFVHIPAEMFQPSGPLFGKVAVAATLYGDDDVGQDGLNTTDPPTQGVFCKPVYLFPGQATTDENGETGVNHAQDNDNDASVDLTVDFGFQIPVGIGNLVFIDSNHNGHADPGEGVGGVKVEVYNASSPPGVGQYLYSTTTTADGHYLFNHLSTGDYIVYLPPSNFQFGHPLYGLLSIPDGGGHPDGDDDVGENGVDAISPGYTGISSTVVHLVPGFAPVDGPGGETGFLASEDSGTDDKVDLTIDFGFTDLPSPVVGVGNLVFKDTNGNLFYDDGEGVDGVVLQLFPDTVTDPLTATPVATTTSSNGGEYYFGNLVPGRYFVFIPPVNFRAGGALNNTLSIPGQGGDDGLDDDQDENGDDPVDPAASGVRSNVVNLQVGKEPTALESESGFLSYVDDGSDSNNDLTIDFGFYETVGVGNVVFKDINGNGRFDSGEGVDGVTLKLFAPGADPQVDVPLATTVTASGGLYSFNRLNAGSYFIYIPGSQFMIGAPLAGLLSVPDTATSAMGDDDVGEDGIDSPNPVANGISSRIFTLTPGAAPTDADSEKGVAAAADNAADADFDATIDFGFYDSGVPILGVGNVVFIDANHNGHFDAGEGVPGITVQLFAVGQPTGSVATSTSITDSNGTYLLRTSVPGDYVVNIPETEFQKGRPLYGLMSLPGNGGDDGVDDDFDENGVDSPHPDITGIRSSVIHLAPGTEPVDGAGETGFQANSDNGADNNYNLTIDFGFDHICPTFSIAPSSLPAGYKDALYSQTLATTSGYAPYTWDLPTGSLPPGMGLDATGGITGIPTATGTYTFTARVTDDTGCTGTASYSLIIKPPPTVGLGNCIYIDRNHNGINDAGEGIAGVEVELFPAGADPLADAPIAEMDTLDGGLYSFTNLTPGDYFVFIAPTEFAIGMPLYGCLSIPGVGGDNGVDDDKPGNDNGVDAPQPDLTGISSTIIHLDFGSEPVDSGSETGTAASSDNANDANTDLTLDLGFQPSCPTITITPTSVPTATIGMPYRQVLQASGGAGPYSFFYVGGSLPTGISISTSGVFSGTSSSLGSYPFTVRATDINNCSTEVDMTLLVGDKVAVGNLVFFDVNGNGHADAGEGIDGVTVELYRSTDTPGVSTPLATTTTANGGLYLFDNLASDRYVLFIPKAMFAVGGPLQNMISVPGAITLGDDDVGEHGLDTADPATTGVTTAAFALSAGLAPTGADTETGTHSTDDDARDVNVDLTQDFGFVDKNPQSPTFSQWTSDNGLTGNRAFASGNPDGDAYSNLIEYALGLDPNSGAESINQVFTLARNANGGVNVILRRRHGGHSDLIYTLQVLPNLNASAWTSTSISPVIVNNFDGTETLTFKDITSDPALASSPDGLVRLKVTLTGQAGGNSSSTATSIIIGWLRRTLAVQTQSYSMPLMPPAIFTGTVDNVNGNTISLATSANGTSLTSLFANGREYYLDVISGSQTGQRWEIDEANSTATTLALLPAHERSTQKSVPVNLSSDVISIRAHWRVSDLFPMSDYHATNNPSTADQVIVWDITNSSYVTLWLANYFGQSHWHQVGIASLTETEDNRVVPPAAAQFVRPRFAPVTAFVTGQMRTWRFGCPLKVGYNFLGNPFPVAQSPSAWGMTTLNGFTGTTNPSTSDRLYFWTGDSSATQGYDTYQLFKTSRSSGIWKAVGSTDLTTDYGKQNLFSNCHGSFINSISGSTFWYVPTPSIPQ